MSSENANSTGNQPGSGSSTEKPRRSKLERAVVWTVILVLVVFTGVEAMSQLGYKKTLKDFETGLDEATEPVTLDVFESEYKTGLTLKSDTTRNGQAAILYKWPSLLRRYEMHFTVLPGEEQILGAYGTNDEPAAMIGQPITGEPDTELADEGGEGGGDDGGGGPTMHDDGTGSQPRNAGGSGRGPGRGNPLRRLLAEEMAAELKLSDEQKTKIQELIDNQQPPDESLSREERIQQFQANREAAMAKLNEILDHEQREKFQAAIANPGDGRPDRPK